MATTAVVTSELPSTADYQDCGAALAAAYNTVERLTRKLGAVESAWLNHLIAPEPLPTFAEVGELWDFAESLELRVRELTEMQAEIGEVLIQVNSIRRDAPLRRDGQ